MIVSHMMHAANPNHDIRVGWDSEMHTYFAHVIDTSKAVGDKGRELLRLGTSSNEITDINYLEGEVREYGYMSPDSWTDLCEFSSRS